MVRPRYLTVLLVAFTLSDYLPLCHAKKPNIIFVLADDLGWSELGCYGNGFNETPNLDQLANDGVRFTQAYAAAPVCSPYRAALLTGQHPARIGIIDYLVDGPTRPRAPWLIMEPTQALPNCARTACETLSCQRKM